MKNDYEYIIIVSNRTSNFLTFIHFNINPRVGQYLFKLEHQCPQLINNSSLLELKISSYMIIIYLYEGCEHSKMH